MKKIFLFGKSKGKFRKKSFFENDTLKNKKSGNPKIWRNSGRLFENSEGPEKSGRF